MPPKALPAVEKFDLDPNGDCILILKERELRVSSRALSLASPVFKALFKPGFAEGNTLEATRGIGRVELPDDDTDAMTTICSVIHYIPKTLPHTMPLEALENLAIVTDKYDCSRAMFSFVGHIISTKLLTGTPIDNTRLLAPAYAFDHYLEFQKITSQMAYSIKRNQQSCPASTKSYGIPKNSREFLPQDLLHTIAAQECKIKSRLFKSIENLIVPLFKRNIPSGKPNEHSYYGYGTISACDRDFTVYFLHELATHRLWPFSEASEKFTINELCSAIDKCVFSYKPKEAACTTCNLNTTVELDKIKKAALDAFPGLCLDCVKRGGTKKGEDVNCRMEHEGFLGIEAFQ